MSMPLIQKLNSNGAFIQAMKKNHLDGCVLKSEKEMKREEDPLIGK